MGYTLKNLRAVEDMAARMGFGEAQEARFPMPDLDAKATGIALIRVKPGQRQPFAHRHNEAEEVYVVLAGSGRVKVGDDIVEVTEMDAIRFDPEHGRAIEAGAEGIEVLAVGPRHEGDAEQIAIAEFWAD